MSLGQVIDYSAGFPGAAAIKAAGYVGAVRYIGLPGNRKNTTTDELDDFRVHELGMALVFERLTTDWTMGYAGGQTFGRAARDHANAIGFPADRPIYMAVDQQVSGAAAHDTAMAYLHGAASVLGGGKAMTGVYGQASVCARARTEGFGYRWQTKAWSGGVVAAGIHLLQNIGTVYVGNVACDTNEVLQEDWGQDGGGDVSAIDDMQAVQITGPDGVKRGGWDHITAGATWAGEAHGLIRATQTMIQAISPTLTTAQLDDMAGQVAVHLEETLGGQFEVTIARKTT